MIDTANRIYLFIGLFALCSLADQAWPQDRATSDTAPGDRQLHILADGWTLERENEIAPIRLGASWETTGFQDFDGVGVYRNTIEPLHIETTESISRGRWLLQIDAAATEAVVRIDGNERGRHLGGWTPFRIDVTDLFRGSAKDRVHEIEIEVDERVGHNTQGFLPIVVPHFGGIWKHVRLIHTADEAYLDDLTLLLSGFRGADELDLEAAVRAADPDHEAAVQVGFRITGPAESAVSEWHRFPVKPNFDQATLASSGTDRQVGIATGKVIPTAIRHWTIDDPFQYETEVVLFDADGKIIDRLRPKAAIRNFQTRGRALLVNGDPVNVRGVLNWGYAPPRLAPTLDEDAMRWEIQFALDRGFNLMKFCLWMPPRRYLDLADEMGMLTWVEYPTWHPDFSDDKLPELRREFSEFFHYDRNAASVLLRSLTCETGHGASVDVIRDLYDLGHRTIPGAIIEDDSSWIGWHRVHDFYDDHPYGNNHTWPAKLRELDQHIATRRSMPLVLGEAVAADTWERPKDIGPPHESLSASKFQQYADQVVEQHRLAGDDPIRRDSYRYAIAMRKYQIETFRWMLPDAGYVVSVIRDFPKAAMGLIGRRGVPKWSEDDFVWHDDITLVLNQGRSSRVATSGQPQVLTINVAGQGKLPDGLQLTATIDGTAIDVVNSETAPERSDQATYKLRFTTPELSAAKPISVSAVLTTDQETLSRNQWTLWVVPRRDASDELKSGGLWTDGELPPEILAAIQTEQSAIVGDARDLIVNEVDPSDPPYIVATGFSERLITLIEHGARCVLLPDGRRGSTVIRDHWFLRGGPIVANHPLVERLGRDFLVDLQAMDLSGPVLFEFPLIDEGTPILSLWDNHDLDRYRTHGLIWEAAIGRGRLLVSTLPVNRSQSAAEPFVLTELLRHVAGDDVPKRLDDATVKRLRSQLRGRSRSLVNAGWRFRPAGAAETASLDSGLNAVNSSWALEPFDDDAWTDIQITQHWDAQGYGDLDGWGLYRTRVRVPDDWPTDRLFLNFTGVDDHYRVHVDGRWIGSDGDLEQRLTAFENRKSHAVPAETARDRILEIAVAVYDWYGAGGIFRPVTLSTEPISPGPPWLVP